MVFLPQIRLPPQTFMISPVIKPLSSLQDRNFTAFAMSAKAEGRLLVGGPHLLRKLHHLGGDVRAGLQGVVVGVGQADLPQTLSAQVV